MSLDAFTVNAIIVVLLLAVLLLVAANGLSSNTGHFTEQTARLPRGGAEQTRLVLKMDPLFSGFRNLHAKRAPSGKTGDRAELFANND